MIAMRRKIKCLYKLKSVMARQADELATDDDDDDGDDADEGLKGQAVQGDDG